LPGQARQRRSKEHSRESAPSRHCEERKRRSNPVRTSELDCFASLAMTSKIVLAARCVRGLRLPPSQSKTKNRSRTRKARGAERRKTHPTMSAVQTSGQAACLRSGRSAPQMTLLAQRLRFRARSPSGVPPRLSWGFDTHTQLQARLPGMSARRALPAGAQAQCRDSTSRRGRSTAGRDARSRPGAVCETARRRRIPLRNQDRIRNAPLGERDSIQK
jgi:hypothetical protein